MVVEGLLKGGRETSLRHLRKREEYRTDPIS